MYRTNMPSVLTAVRLAYRMACKNTYGAVWEVSVLPAPPLDLRITNSLNQQVRTAWHIDCSQQWLQILPTMRQQE